MADPLIESLERLVQQSTAVFGPDDPATLQLKQQLESLTKKEQAKKVFWMAPTGSSPADKKNG